MGQKLTLKESYNYNGNKNGMNYGCGNASLEVNKNPCSRARGNYYFLTFRFGEHETEAIHDRHSIEVEVLAEGSVALGKIEEIGRKRAEKFLKDLVKRL